MGGILEIEGNLGIVGIMGKIPETILLQAGFGISLELFALPGVQNKGFFPLGIDLRKYFFLF